MKSFFLSFFFIALFICVLPNANAQSISDCNSFSDVRPSYTSMSPREKCQCEINSSYCITPVEASPSAVPPLTEGQKCANKGNHIWTGSSCWSCSKVATKAVAGHAMAAALLPSLGIGAACHHYHGYISILLAEELLSGYSRFPIH